MIKGAIAITAPINATVAMILLARALSFRDEEWRNRLPGWLLDGEDAYRRRSGTVLCQRRGH